MCGSIQHVVIYNFPKFVKLYKNTIQIWPQDKSDTGLHHILIQLTIDSVKYFHGFEIMVKLPITFIDSNLVPLFEPPVIDKKKIWSQYWLLNLPLIYEPAHKYSFVKSVYVTPDKASTFLNYFLSSMQKPNSTYTFEIDENDYREVTGNVSIFIKLNAYN